VAFLTKYFQVCFKPAPVAESSSRVTVSQLRSPAPPAIARSSPDTIRFVLDARTDVNWRNAFARSSFAPSVPS
jgi:hypothetical protein